MKTLYLLRHAEAEKSSDDFDRRLTFKGENQAKKVGKIFVEKNIIPNLILYSSSVRTSETKEIIIEESGLNLKSQYNSVLYKNDYLEIFKEIEDVDNSINSLLTIGHIPSLEQILSYYTKNSSESIPTCSLFSIEIDTDSWKEIRKSSGRITSSIIGGKYERY